MLLLTLVVICGGLLVSIVLVSVLASQANHRAEETNRRLTALEGFIADRGEMRDDQYKTLDERINAAVCGLLDKLPAGPILDPLRVTYDCGPGLPVEALTPEAQSQLQGYENAPRLPATREPDRKAPRETPQETTSAPAPTPTAAAPSVASDVPTAAPATTAAATATPTAAPGLDLPRLTDRLCALTGVCA